MRKLRRHDWRTHRNIECTICSEILESRQEITKHRQSVHKMFRKLTCRYYPECYDEEECLFEHVENSENKPNGCPNGQNCTDQECQYTEKEHIYLQSMFCKFKEKCNRSSCAYQHLAVRNSFLVAKHLEKRRK